MRAAVHVIPCAGILQAAGERPPHRGSGLAHAALATAERLEQPADLVLVAVPAGQGQAVADKIIGAGRRANPRPAALYMNERDALKRGAEFDELGDLVERPPEPRA